MIFCRNFLSIFMVVYLPTILMNMINQATNYIPTEDKYQLVYTINMYAKLTTYKYKGRFNPTF